RHQRRCASATTTRICSRGTRAAARSIVWRRRLGPPESEQNCLGTRKPARVVVSPARRVPSPPASTIAWVCRRIVYWPSVRLAHGAGSKERAPSLRAVTARQARGSTLRPPDGGAGGHTMTLRARFVPALALALCAAPAARAQTAGQYSLDLSGARKVTAAIETQATKLGVGPAIAVVDAGGDLVALVRMDGAFGAAPRAPTGKARTAAMFRKPTREFETIVNKGRFTMPALE